VLVPAGALSSGMSGKCLDDGSKIDIWDCTGSAGQDWTVRNDGTIQIMGKCLDVQGAGTANSTPVDLYTCNGGGNQIWEPGPNGWLINPASGKCLDDPGQSTTNGTQLDIYSCVTQNNETWTLPGTATPAPPTAVTVTAGAAAATISWQPTGPAATGGAALTGYTVTASPGGATATAGPHDTTATVSGLTPGTAYTFTLTASNGPGSATTSATTAVTPGNQTTYSYDPAGNLTSSQTDGLTTTSTYNAAEQLTKAATGSTTISYGYDADGNQTSAKNVTYSYNGAGQLTSVDTGSGNFSYGYNSAGAVASTSVDGSTIQGTVWDLANPLPQAVEDTNSSGSATVNYLYGQPGVLAAMSSGSATYVAISDWEGSVTGLVNSSGSQVTTTSYSAYGTPSTTGSVLPGIGYAGSYSLPGGSGVDDMRARDYNPATSEFLSVDPQLAQTRQPYAYVSDSPVAGTDPSGQDEWGLCGSGLAQSGAMATGSGCLVVTFDLATGEFQFGATASGGGGLGMVSAGFGIGIQRSNADQVSDLGGWFGVAGGGVSVGPDISGDGFTGRGACNQQIFGGDAQVGGSADLDPNFLPMWEIHGGATYTAQTTFFSGNLYNVINDTGTSLYKALKWAFG
jgi:RHS repeat-associated protein